jgi:threonine/homoserine/homoserine lactone efflux protein
MLSTLFLKGMIIGFLIAVPVGPINVLCVRRTIMHGRLAGIVSGLGSAGADTLFGAIAVLGLAALESVVFAERFWIALVGAAMLIVLGIRTLLAGAPQPSAAPDPTSLLGDFTSTFILTLTNPITILSFLGIFGAFGINADDAIDQYDGMLLAGVFLGSTVWWLLLTGVIGVFHGHFNETGLRWANRVAGVLILAFAVAVLWEAWRIYV